MRDLPGAVLFACGLNRVRSPMAHELMRRLYGPHVFVDSCGLRQDPSLSPDPFMIAVMDEVGIDLTGHRSKAFEDLDDGSFDVVISLTPEAHHRAGELARSRAVDLAYWPTIDPTLTTGAREQRLDAYRAVRNSLAAELRPDSRSRARSAAET